MPSDLNEFDTLTIFYYISSAKRVCGERERAELGGFSNYLLYDFGIIALPLSFTCFTGTTAAILLTVSPSSLNLPLLFLPLRF